MLLLCSVSVLGIGSAFATSEGQQTAENIANPIPIDEKVDIQNSAQIAENQIAEKQNIDSQTIEPQNTEQNTETALSKTENTVNTVTDTQKTAETKSTSTSENSGKTNADTNEGATESTISDEKSPSTDGNIITTQNIPSTENTENIQRLVLNSAANTQNTTPTTNEAIDNSTNTEDLPQAAGDKTYTNVHGIWIKAEDVNSINITELKKAGITDIFVKANRVSTPTYQTVLKTVLDKLKDTDVRVHAWITCFKDTNGTWIDPADKNQRKILLDMIKDITKNYNIDGIHLDFVRYPGTASQHSNATDTITSFVKDAYNAVKGIKPKVAVSAALMPEGANNAKNYGQDYEKLAPCLDFMVPMIYKGNYGQNTAWIGTTTKYIVEHAGGKPVIAGIMTYVSDYDTTPLTASELNNDIKAATNNGASGYSLFRYGTIDSNFLNIPSFTMAEINAAAAKVKSYAETNKRLPNYVQVGTKQVSMSEFLQLMVVSVQQINSKTTTPITLKYINAPADSTGSFKSGNIKTTEYLDIAKRIKAFMDSNGLASNYATTSLGKVQYESLVYMYSKILNYYNTNKALPTYVSMDPAVKISSPNVSSLENTVFTVAQIQTAAGNMKSYIETNKKLPTYVQIGNVQVNMPDFLRLTTISVIERNDGSSMLISLKSMKAPAEPSETIKSGNLTQKEYVDIAKRVKEFMDSNGAAPNHATTSLGNIQYESLVYMFSKILAFYNTNSRLPSTVSVTPWKDVSTSPSMEVPDDLKSYLLATKNCQVNDSKIKSLAASITKGATSSYDKAVKIFNWVRDNIGYSFYYNTKYGAVGTLNAKTGNCVDTAHLVVALSRAAGLPAKYVHGSCTFTSGNVYGHVWAQIWVNGKWYTADATSSKNSLGVIKNWNTGTATIKGYYRELPF